MKTMH